MDKSKLHHLWRVVRWVKPWHFLILAVISGTVCAYALRDNNLHMVQLRDAVYRADKENGDTHAALNNLQRYVFAHMNTGLTSGQNAVYPPIQLKYTYDRLVAAQTAATNSPDNDIYSQAQKYCEAAFPTGFSGSNRLGCIQSYVKQHGITTAQAIPKSLYQFDFTAPKWSPDLAGWSLLVTIFFVLSALVLAVLRRAFRHALR
jgi:hypothetical protein